MSRSKDYIFKKNNNVLELVGDFEGFYQNNNDPWDQNSKDSDMSSYYEFSRKRLIQSIKSLKNVKTIVEIGCGLGIVTSLINESMDGCILSGIDISETAISKARLKYSHINFNVGNIASPSFNNPESLDVIILNQMLWYILENLDIAIDNVYNILNDEGFLIISMAFLNEQNYGKDIIDGFDGLIDYCKSDINDKFELIYSDLDQSNDYDYNDGIVCLRKINKGIK
ncbi:MAG: class I SAM-dependent methyltransferase [Flavobacteriales bacterium]|nr:class I SAM-dependent methyltransferase [Flavobacteriales bacterium]